MKKYLTIIFLLSVCYVTAGTGKANDELLFILAIILVMSLILAIFYFTGFIRRKIKEYREKKTAPVDEEVSLEI